MFTIRFIAASLLLVLAAGCRSTPSATPVAPTPMTTPPPQPPVGVSPSVRMPAGAAQLGDRAYSPDEVTVALGDSLTWINLDAVTHTSTADDGEWSSGPVFPGQHFELTPKTAGTFTYHCTIHPGMVGRVVVR